MMKQLLKFGLICTIASSGLLFTACGDGDPGIAGEKGEPGDAGQGFDELLQYGNIVMRYKGVDSNNKPFDKTIDFKFSPQGPDVVWVSSSQAYDNGEDGPATRFQIYRFSSAIVNSTFSSNNYAGFIFNKPTDDSEFLIDVYGNVAILNDGVLSSTSISYSFTSEAISAYTFTAATGELKFKLTGTIPAENNATRHALEISGDVNVKVLQNIQIPK